MLKKSLSKQNNGKWSNNFLLGEDTGNGRQYHTQGWEYIK